MNIKTSQVASVIDYAYYVIAGEHMESRTLRYYQMLAAEKPRCILVGKIGRVEVGLLFRRDVDKPTEMALELLDWDEPDAKQLMEYIEGAKV